MSPHDFIGGNQNGADYNGYHFIWLIMSLYLTDKNNPVNIRQQSTQRDVCSCLPLCQWSVHWHKTRHVRAWAPQPRTPRVDSKFAPSQWETSLQSNAVSHRLGANLEPALTPLPRGCLYWLANKVHKGKAPSAVFWVQRLSEVHAITHS